MIVLFTEPGQIALGSIIMFALNAIIPLVLLIGLGYLLKRLNFVNEAFLKVANKLVFKVALPISLFLNVYNVESITDITHLFPAIMFSALAVIITFGLGLGSAILFTKDNRQKGIIIQTLVRSNFAIIGTPLVALLAVGLSPIEKSEADAIASLMMLFVIPIMNILTIIGFSIFPIEGQTKKGIDWKAMGLKIVKNPLIIGIVIGLCFVLARFGMVSLGWVSKADSLIMKNHVKFLYTALDFIAKMTTPLALIALGGIFRFDAVKRLAGQIIHGTLWRVLLVPAIGLTIAVLFKEVFGLTKAAFPALVAVLASPVAVTSVVMAAEMGGDDELQGQLVVWNSIVSILTLFIFVVVLKYLNLL